MSKVIIKTEEQINLLRESSLLVGKGLAEVAKFLRPGVTGLDVDKLFHDFVKDHGATPSFLNYHGFPFSVCFSVNEQVVHGFPTKKELKEGDVVSVDCGVFKNGFHGDSAYTFAIGEIKPEAHKLLTVTKQSLYLGIQEAVAGKRTGDIGCRIQDYVEGFGFSVVRELVGHGLGENLHEGPEVPNYGKRGNGYKLQEGVVIAIEPMVNLGKKEVATLQDGWTIVTRDRKISAHYEHDVCVRAGKAEILSSFEEIEKEEKKNINLTAIE